MKCIILCAALLSLGACEDRSARVMREIEQQEQREAAMAQSHAQDSTHFIDAAKARAGAIVSASGLVYEFVRHSASPNLPHPTPTSNVKVNYEGSLIDGTVFDSSFERGEPAEFPLDQVVAGFSEAIQQMAPGDEVIATFPAALGYGPEGHPPAIPRDATLQFRIQLLSFEGPNGRTIQAPRG